MSSHHIVREGQEPAVILTGSMTDAIGQLLEWSPVVIGLSAAIDDIVLHGIKVDAVVIPLSRKDEVMQKLAHQFPLTILHAEPADEISTSLDFLLASKHNAVTLLADNPPVLFEELIAFSDKLAITVVDDSTKWSLVASGRFSKWLASGEILQISAIDGIFEGLQKIDNSTFQTLATGHISVTSKAHFWIGESLR